MSEQTSTQPDKPIYRHIGCGLQIESDIRLPGLASADPDNSAPLVRIEQAGVPLELTEGVIRSGPNWQRTENTFLLRLDGIARFLIEDASSIQYAPEDNTDPEELTAFLTGSVLGLLLHLRGAVVLHASAVMVGERAVLFCGLSGAGKSTISAALGERGYPMVSDDLCALSTANDGTVMVVADGREHKLWDQALDGLDLNARKGEEVRAQINKFFVEPRDRVTKPVPVGALYELVEHHSGEVPEITTLAASDAAQIVRNNAFRPLLMRMLDQKADYFRVAASLASQGEIAQFRRPLDFDKIAEGLDLLEAAWRDKSEQPMVSD